MYFLFSFKKKIMVNKSQKSFSSLVPSSKNVPKHCSNLKNEKLTIFCILLLLVASIVCKTQCKFSDLKVKFSFFAKITSVFNRKCWVKISFTTGQKIHRNWHFAMYANFPMNDDKINPDQFPEDANSKILNCDYNMYLLT